MTAHADRSGVDLRLRWWALVLPALSFAALLTLLVTATGAEPGATGQRQPVSQLIEQVRATLLH